MKEKRTTYDDDFRKVVHKGQSQTSVNFRRIRFETDDGFDMSHLPHIKTKVNIWSTHLNSKWAN